MRTRSLSDKIEFFFAKLAEAGVPVPPGSRFDRMRRVFLDEEGRPNRFVSHDAPEFRTALEALRDFYFIEPVLVSFAEIEIGDAKRTLKTLLKDEVLPHAGKKSSGRDIQAELFVAATCALAEMHPVSLEEPDVRAVLDGQGWRIAAKRVKSQSRLDDNLRDGADQISRHDEPGVIFLDVSRAFDPHDEQARLMPRAVFEERLGEALRRGVEIFEKSVFGRARAKGVGLVYFFFSCLRQDPDLGWVPASIHMDVDTSSDDTQREQCLAFRAAFSQGIERLAC